MPNFCYNCGNRFLNREANFCDTCGKKPLGKVYQQPLRQLVGSPNPQKVDDNQGKKSSGLGKVQLLHIGPVGVQLNAENEEDLKIAVEVLTTSVAELDGDFTILAPSPGRRKGWSAKGTLKVPRLQKKGQQQKKNSA